MNIVISDVDAKWVELPTIVELNQTPLILDIQLQYPGIQITRTTPYPVKDKIEKVTYIVDEAVDKRGPRV